MNEKGKQKASGFWKVDAVISKIVMYISKISPAFLIIIGVAATVNVIYSKITGSSIPSVNDWIKHFMLPAVWLSLGNVAINRDLIRVDFISKHYPKVLERAVQAFSFLLGTAVIVFITVRQWSLLVENLETGKMSSVSTLNFHIWPFNVIMVIGLAITAFAFFWCAIRQFVPGERKEEAKA
ncbi:MAG: TRAP transporter small permease subunit [Lachnospiraceae bacterium]|nr:TRAP transporter small permease subunit [Lachnospiraceae bacterium]